MPIAPPTPCRRPGCPVLVDRRVRPRGYCEADERFAPNRQADLHRGSSSARGYDYRWQRFREQFLREHPLCEMECATRGLVTAAEVVDHIQSIAEAPHRRFDRTNLRAGCKPCHDARTMRDQVNGARRTS